MMWCRVKRSFDSLMLLFVATIMLASCTPYPKDYVGYWVGIDETVDGCPLYEFSIASMSETTFTVKVIQKRYNLRPDNSAIVWLESPPKYYEGIYDPNDGVLICAFGIFDYSVKNGSMKLGNINLIRKAKNSEVKLKYVARKIFATKYPDIPIAD